MRKSGERGGILKTPPLELLPNDGFDLVGFVEGVPELGDDEEVFALYDALFKGTLYALATLLLVAVVSQVSEREEDGGGEGYQRHRQRGGSPT
jgi:hypothetical protein